MSGEIFDCIVVGGGPAGSSVATYLARAGRKVLVLERERFPREHIGESLLPGVIPYLDALGAREKVEAAGFERKEGQTFVWGQDRRPWQLDFRELDQHPYAYFVDRAKFDALLLDHSASCGAEVRTECTVTRVLFENGRAVGVTYTDASGATRTEHARFVVDASGPSALVARGANLRRNVRGLKNLAFWSYWDGAERLPAHQRAHILTVSIDDGWVWAIPLADRMSVGIVTSSSATRAAREAKGAEAWYLETLQQCEPVWSLLKNATRRETVTGARDWSYRARRTSGPGVLLAGDAACFIDPILSTGVHLAMSAGYWAAACVHSSITEPRHEALFRRFYDETYATQYRELLAQVKAFYRAEVNQQSVYWTSKKVLRSGGAIAPSLAFLFITAGLLRNAATESPADPAAQARVELGTRVAPWAGNELAAPRSRSRAVSPPMVWRVGPAGRPSLVTVRADGLRLQLARYEPRGPLDRPRGSFFAIELHDRDELPVGLAVFEEAASPDARGATLAPRFVPYPVRPHATGSSESIEAALRNAVARSVVADPWSLANAKRALRTELKKPGALPEGLGITRSRVLRGGGVAEPPLSAVYEAPSADAPLSRVYVQIDARVPVELAEIPVLRTRFLDVWISPDKTRDGRLVRDWPPAAALIDHVTRRLWDALAREPTRSAAFARAEATLGSEPSTQSGFRLLACGRLGALGQTGTRDEGQTVQPE